VSISSDFGVGESVTIRGISENRVELNGRSTSGTGRGGISLDDYPSSFLKTVEVIKSPTADMIEGALGGTINMKTVRPLELDEALVAVTLDAEYADKTENVAPKFTGAFGNNWDLGSAGTFGATAVVSYQDREIRQDEFQAKMISKTSIDGFDEAGKGANGTYTYRGENTVRIKEESRERIAFGGSLQWAPESGKGMVYVDLSASELEGGQLAYDYLDVGGTVTGNSNSYQSETGQLMNYDLVGAFVIPKTESDFAKNSSYSNAIGGEWYINDSFTISGEIAITGSEEDGVNSQVNLRPVDRNAYVEGTDPGGYMNTFTAEVENASGKIPGVTYSDATALTSGDTMAFREMWYDTYTTDNDETAIRLDTEYFEPMGVDWISSVKAGVRVTSREYEYKTAQLENNNGDQFGDVYKKAKYDDGSFVTPTWINEFSGTEIITHDNLFDQSGYVGNNDLANGVAVYNAALLRDNPNAAFEQMQAMYVGTQYATTGSLNDNINPNEEEFARIEEDTSAIYASFNLDFDELTAVIGARYVRTKLDSTYYGDETDDGIDNAQYITRSNDYNDFLPSMNATYTFNDDTLIRFAAAKVMRRADFTELSPALVIDGALLSANQGSYQLDPKRVTQYDLSVEHYFDDGALVSAAIFYKDVKSFTISNNSCVADPSTITEQQVADEWTTACQLTAVGVNNPNVVTASVNDFTPEAGKAYVESLRDQGLTGVNVSKQVNGGSGKVSGLELAYQQQFSFLPGAWSGLGINTNYTYADSEQPNGLPLQNISKNSFNFQLYWENDSGVQLRAAYNWRDSYMDDEAIGKRLIDGGIKGYGSNSNRTDPTSEYYDPTSENSYRESRGTLDLSASYDINENISVVANAVNVTGEPLQFTSAQGHDWRITEADRRYTVGIRAKF